MGMSDCPKCWNAPCTCGYEYRNYSEEKLIKMRDLLEVLIHKKQISNNKNCDGIMVYDLKEKI